MSLAAFAGGPPPSEMVADAESVSKLTPSAIKHLMEVLEPCLARPMDSELAQVLSHFCLRHEVAEADLGRAVRACRSLLRAASSVNLDVAAFSQDALKLFHTQRDLAELLVSRFEPLKASLRNELFLNALVEHGAVLDDVDWRLDYVAATGSAPRLLVPVALLSLSYRDHGVAKKMTLQVPGKQLEKLKLICSALLK